MILADLIIDYNNGMSMVDLKKKHNISKAKIYKLLATNNVPRERQSTVEKRRSLRLVNIKTVIL